MLSLGRLVVGRGLTAGKILAVVHLTRLADAGAEHDPRVAGFRVRLETTRLNITLGEKSTQIQIHDGSAHLPSTIAGLPMKKVNVATRNY